VGIDWGSQQHQLCVLDDVGQVVRECAVPHRAAGLRQLVDWLRELTAGDLRRVAVAIETPRGAVVEALVDAGAHVYHLNPKQLDRFRDRHSVAGAKDDRRDAFVLACSLRTDLPCFRRIDPEDPLIVELREASRLDSRLLAQHTALANQLGAQLHRYWPQLLELAPGADEPWLWDLLARAAHPYSARRLTQAKLAKLLREHRIRRFDAEQLVAVLRQPPLPVAAGTLEAATMNIELLVPQLQLICRQRRQTAARLKRLLAQLSAAATADPEQPPQHRDAEILLSMPGVGKLVAATVLGEAAGPIARRDYQLLRALTGIAPVTRASGKSRHVAMRRACNQRLRNAVYHWALNSLQNDDASHLRYQALRHRGKTHGHALRLLADGHLRTLTAMLRDGTLHRSRNLVAPPSPTATQDEHVAA